MNKMDHSLRELREMDELAVRQSPIHALCPLAKLLTTIAYIVVVVSFGKYDLSGLMVMVLYPVLLFQISGIPVGTCFRKLRFVLPLVMAVGLFNPLFDRAPLLMLGHVAVSGGVVSMLTLMAKGVFCLMASFIPACHIWRESRPLAAPRVLTATIAPVGMPLKQKSKVRGSAHCRVGTTFKPIRCQYAPMVRLR